ncbi:MAG: hypothetical protein AB7O38_12610 [Pirellulaceae bacterium]
MRTVRVFYGGGPYDGQQEMVRDGEDKECTIRAKYASERLISGYAEYTFTHEEREGDTIKWMHKFRGQTDMMGDPLS